MPNVLRAYAFDIAKLDGFTAVYNDLMLGPSGLSKLEREMIAVAVSSINRCWYCQVAHGAAVRELSGTPELGERLVMNWRTASSTDGSRDAGLCREGHAREPPVGEADRQALRDAGFSDRDIWDIASVAGFFAMSNRVASATGMVAEPGVSRARPMRAALPHLATGLLAAAGAAGGMAGAAGAAAPEARSARGRGGRRSGHRRDRHRSLARGRACRSAA